MEWDYFRLCGGDILQILQPENSTLILALGVITFIAAILDFYALKVGKLSVIEFVLEIELPITVILGILFFNEILSTLQWVIVGIAFLGIAFISLERFNLKASHFLEKGVIFAGLGALFMALVNFLTASASRGMSPLLAIWAPSLIFTIISLVYLFQQQKFSSFLKSASKNKKAIIAMGIVDTAAWVFFAIALADHPLGITVAITESYPAVALFFGMHFNREKIKKHQWAGAALALGASILLGFLV